MSNAAARDETDADRSERMSADATYAHDELFLPNDSGAQGMSSWDDRVDLSLDRAIKLLVDHGVIDPRQGDTVLSSVRATGEPLDRALAAAAIPEELTVRIFAEHLGWARLADADSCDAELAQQLSAAFVLKERVFPLRGDDGALYAAIADPTSKRGLAGCAFAFGKAPLPLLCATSQMDALLRRLYPEDAETLGEDYDGALGEDAERLRDLASGEPAVRLCTHLVGDAVLVRASDIHLEAGERGYRVRFRIDGVLAERPSLTVKQGLAAISRLKILGNLDIAERRRPQDGRFSFSVAGRPLDLRLSTTPSVFGEDVVIRLLQRETVQFDLAALGFSESAASRLHTLTDRPHGIILLTGPTGCGKTTTLYTLLRRLATSERKILTIEDPVEYRIAGISQTQVNPAIGLDFAKGLRSFLRHDPDIIMVGEMRDLETARTAVQAAMTGHLVLSTLHTNDAPSAVTRLLDMGVEDYLVASTLLAVVGQRLVRRICGACAGAPHDIAATPCVRCGGSGFFGRLSIAEVLEIDDSLRGLIKRGVTAGELKREAIARGFVTLSEDGAAKIAAGRTTRAELERAVAE